MKTFGVTATDRLGKLDLLVVQDLFLTETAQLADVVLPAAAAYEKNGTMTNTAGEIQLVRKGGDVMGPRSDFDILRILSHPAGASRPRTADLACALRTPRSTKFGSMLPGTMFPWPRCCSAKRSVRRRFPANGNAKFDVPGGPIFSAHDTLFTSGSLGRYCSTILSLPEAAEEVEVEARS